MKEIEMKDPIIIHPSKPYFLDLESISSGILDRYRGLPDATLPLKAKLVW